MEEEPTQHIGPAELAALLEEARCGEDDGLETNHLHRHLALCAACREQFEELAGLDRQFKHLRPVQSVQCSDECPQATVWREIAAGLPQSEETLAYVQHASECDYCAPLLREAVLEFARLNRELTDDERKQVASLQSAGREWQERLARQIAGKPLSALDHESAPWWQHRLSLPRQLLVAASVVVVAGVGSWIVFRQVQLRHQPAAAESLLARAYTRKRTLELRIAGAAYAPIRVSRGEAGSFNDRPNELLSAEALISGQLESQPASAPWLRAQAEADMLEGKYQPAVDGMRRALELEPHSPALLIDLATAYFQRSLAQDRKDDLGAAYEDLSKALQLEPGDPVALFNRAVVSEHLFLYHQALDDWEHYLSVDPTSQWAQEARSHLDAVRAKLKEHSEMKPPMSADQLAAVASGASPPSGVDQRIEEYLDEAVRSWLPASFPEVRGNEVAKSAGGVTETRLDRDPSALQALFFLADLTSQRHGDNWLADLLRGSSVPHFPQAVGALARAVKANHSGEYDVSRQQADLAEQLFWASGNTAGVLRAKFEQTFSAQMERRSEDCRRKASTTLTQAERYSYSWLQSQLGLEKSICSGLMGDIGGSKLAGQTAMQCARRKGYGALYLRALGVLADDEFAAGDPSRGSKLASAGLEAYWADQYPARRGYNLYTELAYSAETEARSNLQMSTWSEAVALIDSDDNLSFRAMAHNTLANAAVAAGFSQFAKEQYVEAGDLFAAGPRTEGSRNHALETEVRTAKLEAQLGRFDEAIARLTAIQDQLRPLKNNYLAQMFYSTLGELQLGRRRESEAEQALLPALALSEQTLATLKSEAERSIWSKNAAPAYLSLVEAQLVQGRSAEALDTFEWYLGAPQRPAPDRQPHPTSTNPPLPDPSRLESSRLLLAKETLIAYAVLPDGLAIWVYDNRGINANWIPQSTGGLQELAERFHSLSSDPGSELTALRRDARSLYGSLIAPVEQHLSAGRTLVIEADGWLARVPFEALLDANGRYLIERAPIVHSLGQDSQVRLRADTAISADLRALVVGSSASSPAEGLIPLPEVAAEADAVASDFKSARLLEGGEATLGAVRSELPGAAVFHFAGHAIVSSGRTGLMLGGKNDGGQANTLHLLDADTVRQLRLQSLQLAVLSACNTASGSGGSSGFDSVTDALLRSGVPHVVASRWAVESTPKFVRDFYGNALLGESVSNAIRLASLKMLANPDTSHPYYWSAFAAYGRP